jgi:hypothetical protein
MDAVNCKPSQIPLSCVDFTEKRTYQNIGLRILDSLAHLIDA